MWTYYFVVIYTMIIVGFVKPTTKELKKTKLILLILPIFIYAAIRGNGKGDYFNYISRGQYLYNWSDVFHRNIGMEIGYKIVSYVIKILRLPRQSVIIVFNFISALCLYDFIKRYSTHWTMSVLLYLPIFFQFEMHAARTGVAISIVFWGMKYIEDRKFIKYCIVVIIASSFHTTAIVALILYWLYKVKLKTSISIIILTFDLLFSMFIGLDRVVSIILSSLHLNSILTKYLAYSSSVDYGYSMKIYDPRILIGVIVYLVCCSFIKDELPYERFSLNSIYIYVFLMIAFSNHTFLAYRISIYFYYPIIALLPKLISDNRMIFGDNKKAKVLIFYVVLFSFSMLNFVYASKNLEYIVFWKNGQGILPW